LFNDNVISTKEHDSQTCLTVFFFLSLGQQVLGSNTILFHVRQSCDSPNSFIGGQFSPISNVVC